jgi:hypothetical protein
MPVFKLLVFTNPVAGRDDEYNDWYDNQHLPDTMTFRGWKFAQRFKTVPRYLDRDAPARYVAIYEIEADSMEEALRSSEEGTAGTFITDALDLESAWVIPLTPIGPALRSDEARAADS